MMELFFTSMHLFTSQDINCQTGVLWITCGLLWCFYQLFGLSFWRHPFTAEDPLMSKWCNAKLKLKNSSTFLDGLRVSKCSSNFHFWVNYSFKFYIILSNLTLLDLMLNKMMYIKTNKTRSRAYDINEQGVDFKVGVLLSISNDARLNHTSSTFHLKTGRCHTGQLETLQVTQTPRQYLGVKRFKC